MAMCHSRVSTQVLAARLEARTHFMRPNLLASQLEMLEAPTGAFEIDADDNIDVVTARVIARMRILTGVLRFHR